MGEKSLVVFTKWPAMGVAKTRLARAIGKSAAWRINRTMTAQLLRRLDGQRWRLALAVSPDIVLKRPLPGLWPSRLVRRPQGGGDLGARLERVLRAATGPIVIIGADAPDVCARDIWHAFEALRRADAVFGPAVDGGFWLIGLRRRIARRVDLSGVRWSSAHALADVGARLPVKTAFLRRLVDLDDDAAYRTWRAARAARRMARMADGAAAGKQR
jgi:rSAM/selenodomain-associated transferase 1